MMNQPNVPERILMGPGPSDVPSQVLRALSAPTVGHLDPFFLDLVEQTKGMLRQVFETGNRMTFPLSGTGTAGMESCLANLLEPGDRVLVCVNGYFGLRICDIAARCGAEVVRVEQEWGKAFDPQTIREELQKGKFALVAIVHAETSTGVLQPLEEISRLTHEAGALLLVDTVTSLGGCPVQIDRWQVDASYSASQKCLSAPPGLSPITFSEAAMERLRRRQKPVQSFYLDVNLIDRYYGTERAYHHTAPINAVYALHEALRLVLEEGLSSRFARHRQNHLALVAGIEALGLKMHVSPGERLWMLNTVRVPEGIDEAALRRGLLTEFGIEVGGGLGELKGRVIRIGLMGHSCNRKNVTLLLSALAILLNRFGMKVDASAALSAAEEVYRG